MKIQRVFGCILWESMEQFGQVSQRGQYKYIGEGDMKMCVKYCQKYVYMMI